ncbi:hypothetical protein L211DRAFT_523728 [Terfezia boudieri ATCC MYA-4762]|uniref:Uncharacterized protein n=1 Tax=Terfezia boudieri ATCC MYA-4762 TaxID=1051890 RepID=A0A3N4LQZ5_9PEZI|nr:hypothetical protein L211DRAFT_523728 [Terfezia boudieri ATCC MYA-4762]
MSSRRSTLVGRVHNTLFPPQGDYLLWDVLPVLRQIAANGLYDPDKSKDGRIRHHQFLPLLPRAHEGSFRVTMTAGDCHLNPNEDRLRPTLCVPLFGANRKDCVHRRVVVRGGNLNHSLVIPLRRIIRKAAAELLQFKGFIKLNFWAGKLRSAGVQYPQHCPLNKKSKHSRVLSCVYYPVDPWFFCKF